MNPRRTGSPQRAGAFARRVGSAGAGLAILAVVAAEPPAADTSEGLASVLEVPRLPDVDVLFLREEGRRNGTIRNEEFHLRTPQGSWAFPTRVVAALDLTDRRGGLDVLITVNGNRLSGFLEEPAFLLEAGPAGERRELRCEKVLKVVLRRRPGELDNLPRGALVRLRNGDFFTGALLDDRFRLEERGEELQWTRDRVTVVTFPGTEDGMARLSLASGEVVRGAAGKEDLEFLLDIGLRVRIYRGRIEEIRSAGALPLELRRSLGAGETAGSGPRPPGLADPGVEPDEGMTWIPPGEFEMGAPAGEKDRDLDEGPTTHVVLPLGFWIGGHEVTQVEYEALMGRNPSQYLGDGRRPVERVSWQEAMDYCRKLTERERAAGHLPEAYRYRLPTEAEWEYACRAGTTTRFSHGDDLAGTGLRDYAWFNGNSDSTTHPVGLKKPNAWGLHDLHGNVLEWCLDPWRGGLPGGTVTNHAVLPEGNLRVARGGSWLYEARFCRSANRDSYGVLNRCSDVGFRVVLARVPDE